MPRVRVALTAIGVHPRPAWCMVRVTWPLGTVSYSRPRVLWMRPVPRWQTLSTRSRSIGPRGLTWLRCVVRGRRYAANRRRSTRAAPRPLPPTAANPQPGMWACSTPAGLPVAAPPLGVARVHGVRALGRAAPARGVDNAGGGCAAPLPDLHICHGPAGQVPVLAARCVACILRGVEGGACLPGTEVTCSASCACALRRVRRRGATVRGALHRGSVPPG